MSATGSYRALGWGGYEVLDVWDSDSDGRVRVLIEAPPTSLAVNCPCLTRDPSEAWRPR